MCSGALEGEHEMLEKAREGSGLDRVRGQHAKGRMAVFDPGRGQMLLLADHSIAGALCVGVRCTDNESLPAGPLHL